MNTSRTYIEHLSPQYFWDVDPAKLNDVDSKRLIIERTINFGSLKEIHELIQHYGKKEVVKMIRKISYLDPKTLNFISRLFEIPLSSFRCHTRKSLKPPRWNS